MRFTHDMAVAFGDWLERDGIRHALVAARPELADLLILDQHRPLLRIPRLTGGSVVVARMAEAEAAPWIVGVTAASAPALHGVDTAAEAVALALELLARPAADPHGTEPVGPA